MIYDLFKAIWLVASIICIGRAIDQTITDLYKFFRQGVMSKAVFERGRAGGREATQSDPSLNFSTPLKNDSSGLRAKSVSEINSQIKGF